MEHFNRKYVEHVNLKKDDGYTPLHLAALNDHLDVVTAFAEVVSDPGPSVYTLHTVECTVKPVNTTLTQA